MKKLLLVIMLFSIVLLSSCYSSDENNYLPFNEEDYDLIQFVEDWNEAFELGYTFEVVNGVVIEYRNGIATGDEFTNEELLEMYLIIGD